MAISHSGVVTHLGCQCGTIMHGFDKRRASPVEPGARRFCEVCASADRYLRFGLPGEAVVPMTLPRADTLRSNSCGRGPLRTRVQNRQTTHAIAEMAIVTVIAPPIRVAICAKGMSSIRLAAVKIATSPVPP